MKGTTFRDLKWRIFLFINLLVFCCADAFNDNALAKEINVKHAREEILSYFIPIEGRIIALEDNDIIIDIGKEKKIKKGMRFSVFKIGEPFYHPITRQFLGNTEHLKGSVQIKEVFEEQSIAKILDGNPMVGDQVRIPSSKLKLAFFQYRGTDWSISNELFESLKNSNRFELLEIHTSSYEIEALSELSQQLKARVFLLLSTKSSEESLTFNIKLFWTDNTTPIAEIKDIVSLVSDDGDIDDNYIPIIADTQEPWLSYALTDGKLLSMGDVDGDGKKDIVISDGEKHIRIYSYEEAPIEKSSIKVKKKGQHLSIDVLDFNHNGRAEIFVTLLKDKKTIHSYIFELNKLNQYEIIAEDIPYCFRVMGKTLLMQSFKKNEGLTGSVYKGVLKRGTIELGVPFELPKDVNIYGFTSVGHSNDGYPLFAVLDNSGYLSLYKKDELLWRSENKYHGFVSEYAKKKAPLIYLDKSFVRGRLISFQTMQGTVVLVVNNKNLLSNSISLGLKRAEVFSYCWDGKKMIKEKILRINGEVTDYWLEKDNLFLLAKPSIFVKSKELLTGNLPTKTVLHFYRPSIK